MNYSDLDFEFNSLLKQKPEFFYRDYLNAAEKVANSTAIYKNKPVPFLLHAMFWTEKDIEAFKNISRTITSITDKISERYFKDAEYRKLFDYSEDAERLILREKGYERNVPIGRFDIFYTSPDDFTFCEINTDGSSAMNEDNAIAEILKESEAFKAFGEKYEIESFELIDSWVDKLLGFYEKWGGKGKPNVAILDFKASATPNEFEVFKSVIKSRGYNVEIVDPVDTVYKDGKLYCGDYRIDLVYRRLVTFELLERIDEIQEFINAYMDNAFCSVGEVRSQIMHNKQSFKVIRDEYTLSFLDDYERDFVLKHFPKTGTLSNDKSLLDELIKNKDNYVIKPNDKNASQGVFIGKDLSTEDWAERLKENAETGYLYQQFRQPTLREHSIYKNGEWERVKLGSVVGLFIYDGEFQGIYTRVSESNLITGISNYYTLPNFTVKIK